MKQYTITINKREIIGDDLYLLTTNKPHGFNYLAGQFVMIRADINGQLVQRAYSLASHPLEPFLLFYIKKVTQGLMSNFLYQLPLGSQLTFTGPFGVNTPERIANKPKITYIAAGCGIASVRGLVLDIKKKQFQTIVHQEKFHKYLIWQNIFKEYGTYIPILSRDRQDKYCWHGHVQDFVDKILSDNTSYIIIGSADFIASVKEELVNYKLKNIEIHLEQY